MFRLVLGVIVAILVNGSASAEFKFNPLFSDHAVLQRGQPIPVWGTADPGADVVVTFRGEKAATKTDGDGKWFVTLPEQKAGGPFELSATSNGHTVSAKDILIGEVWICSGQSNMEWPVSICADADKHIAEATNPTIRLFKVPLTAAAEPQTTVQANWKVCSPDTVKSFSAVGYMFGRDIHRALGVPVGLIQTAWGGTAAEAWTSREALLAEPSLQHYPINFRKAVTDYDPAKAKEAFEKAKSEHPDKVAKAKEEGRRPPGEPRLQPDPSTRPNPTTLYNAMLAPLVPYGMRGVIWYQGEQNGQRGFEYRTLFPVMIKDWRRRWNVGDFPFLAVQLAPFGAGNPDGLQWAELRDAQLLATQVLPNVGLAVITDVGEKNDIHPKKKEPVGGRLALLARKMAYGENLVANGPQFKSQKIEGNRVILTFDSVGDGLEARGGPLTGFTICSGDGKFVPAQAEIRGDTIEVWADGVEPCAVRFGWKNFPEVNLFNKNGLPASPFRTDSFPLTSEPAVKKAA